MFMWTNILSHSCPFCYVSFLRTKWLYYYLNCYTRNKTKETEDVSLSVILKNVLKIHYIHLIPVKTNFTFYWRSCTFTKPNVTAKIMAYVLENPLFLLYYKKKNIIIMSVHFCQLLCEIYRGNALVC